MTHLSHCSIHPIPYIASFSLLYYSSCIGMSIYIWPIDWLRTLVFANNGCGFGLAKGACGGGRWWANPSYPLPSAGAGALALRLWSARRRKTTRYCLRHKCPPLAPTPSRRAFSPDQLVSDSSFLLCHHPPKLRYPYLFVALLQPIGRASWV